MGRPRKVSRIESQTHFTNREVSSFLSNSVIAVMNPPIRETDDGKRVGGKIADKRIQKLRPFTVAIIAPLVEYVEEGLLTDEELIACLVVGAQYLHRSRILRTEAYEKPEEVTIGS